ncbi:LCP family protein [Patescibacteria group bacterium]|nr:LCP family protein [Patescibacteria group bacterium]
MKTPHIKVYILFAVLAATFIFLLFRNMQTIFPSLVGSGNNFAGINATVTPEPPTIDESIRSGKPIDILLLGYGGPNHDGPYLTDSMILLHIDIQNKRISLISIPRDLWLKLPIEKGSSGTYEKINSAYVIGMDDRTYPNKPQEYKSTAGVGNMVKYAVKTVTGFDVQRFAALDFDGFVQAVDALGGVDVSVPVTFDDFEYPVEGKENDLCDHKPEELPTLTQELITISPEQIFPCRFEHIHFDSGLQHMDGSAALKFVRSRHSEVGGSDFGRSSRQRNFMEGVKNKVISLGLIQKLLPLYNSLSGHVQTDLTLSEIGTLLSKADNFSKFEIRSVGLSDQNMLHYTFSSDGQYILSPKGGTDSWDVVQKWIKNEIDATVQPVNPVIMVENGTDISGLGELAANRLAQENFRVIATGDAPEKNLANTEITLYSNNLNGEIINLLENEFGVRSVTTRTVAGINYNILITVGRNYSQKHS